MSTDPGRRRPSRPKTNVTEEFKVDDKSKDGKTGMKCRNSGINKTRIVNNQSVQDQEAELQHPSARTTMNVLDDSCCTNERKDGLPTSTSNVVDEIGVVGGRKGRPKHNGPAKPEQALSQVEENTKSNEGPQLGTKRKRQEINKGDDDDSSDLETTRRTPVAPSSQYAPTILQANAKSNQSRGSDSYCDADMTPLNESSHALLDECLEALLYQDGDHKRITHRTLKLINGAKNKVDEASFAFMLGFRRPSITSFLEAERLGCNHPLFYYQLGERYREAYFLVPAYIPKVFSCFYKSIAGTHHLFSLLPDNITTIPSA